MKCSRKDTTFIRDISKRRFSAEFDPDKNDAVFDIITNAMKYSRGDKRVEFQWNKIHFII